MIRLPYPFDMSDGFNTFLGGISKYPTRCMINTRECMCAAIDADNWVAIFLRELLFVYLSMGANLARYERLGSRCWAQV